MSKISSRVDLALHKPVHTNENRKTAVCITDGNPSTCWTSTLYPAYAQIDLRGCYRPVSYTHLTLPTSDLV